jgi:hypothetical protein
MPYVLSAMSQRPTENFKFLLSLNQALKALKLVPFGTRI